jgi:hypothetical protein
MLHSNILLPISFRISATIRDWLLLCESAPRLVCSRHDDESDDGEGEESDVEYDSNDSEEEDEEDYDSDEKKEDDDESEVNTIQKKNLSPIVINTKLPMLLKL